jgi:hypothetical protein
VSQQIRHALRVSVYNPDNQARREYRRIRQNQSSPSFIRNPFRQSPPNPPENSEDSRLEIEEEAPKEDVKTDTP